jgi:hypothetical protein
MDGEKIYSPQEANYRALAKYTALFADQCVRAKFKFHIIDKVISRCLAHALSEFQSSALEY